jgi:hypothetical protein
MNFKTDPCQALDAHLGRPLEATSSLGSLLKTRVGGSKRSRPSRKTMN